MISVPELGSEAQSVEGKEERALVGSTGALLVLVFWGLTLKSHFCNGLV